MGALRACCGSARSGQDSSRASAPGTLADKLALAGGVVDRFALLAEDDVSGARLWVSDQYSQYGTKVVSVALLHRLGPPTGLPVDAVLRSRARPERIRQHYDDLLRTAASLKRGWVPASLLITRLKNATPQSPLAAALGEYGRVVRTNFLLVYCADPQSAPGSPASSIRARPCTRCAATS